MIDSITGALAAKNPTSTVVRVGGFNMRILISVSCFETLPAIGREITLLTYLHVREDALQLYGFSDEVERNLFERLISVSGIGPRLAVGILSGATASRVREAIESGDADFLVTLPGVGKKLASRLVVELREKFTPAVTVTTQPGAGTPGALQVGIAGDAAAALVSLGFTRSGAVSAVQEALQDLGANATVETVIRKALQQGVR
ncbi:MAG: Holliday junction branch migration protein RuvA [Candidatus Eisenbacteria bacterium]|uniref:Holliday junction branch migration complex subunit RuvA n=1 Tax=Eiseniibacteriota bacterium TaxID=2212470 RepID=A0A538TI74_UNCEI|nr:MAG: Holliday junction branch migration protein RuvA [Candidatus Eisenbacteria bacterium]